MSEFLTITSIVTAAPGLTVTVGMNHCASPSTAGGFVTVVVVVVETLVVVVVVTSSPVTVMIPLSFLTGYVNSVLSLNTMILSPKPISYSPAGQSAGTL